MTRSHNDAWPDNAVTLLRTLWAQGNSDEQIAKVLRHAGMVGLTRCAVIGKRNRLGLHRAGFEGPNKAMKTGAEHGNLQRKLNQRKTLRPPPMKVERVAPRQPVIGPTSVRFDERKPSQCPMFCAGEEGARGFVCGEAVEIGETWCKLCRPLVFVPLPPKRAAA